MLHRALLALALLVLSSPASADEPRFELRARGGLGIGGNMAALLGGGDALYRVDPHLWAGVSWTEIPGAWDTHGGDNCSSSGDCWYEGRWILARAEGHLFPTSTLDPWAGVGLGMLQVSGSRDRSAFTGLSADLGLDVRLGHFVVGPSVGVGGPLGDTGDAEGVAAGTSDPPLPWIVTYQLRAGASF
jgi:hypothetical protein